MRLGRYGELELSLRGRYQIENATLAVQGAGNMHGRLPGIAHGSPEYVEAIRAGLSGCELAGSAAKTARRARRLPRRRDQRGVGALAGRKPRRATCTTR